MEPDECQYHDTYGFVQISVRVTKMRCQILKITSKKLYNCDTPANQKIEINSYLRRYCKLHKELEERECTHI